METAKSRKPITSYPNKERLSRDFFLTDRLTLAKNLLGKIMVHETPEGPIRAVITET